MFCSEMCVRVCDMGLQIMGGYGLCDEYQVERMYRDAKLLTIGEGTSEICRMVVGRFVLKSINKSINNKTLIRKYKRLQEK